MNYIKIGKIYTTHGLKGELKVKSNFKYKEKIYVNNFKFYIGSKKELVILNSFRKQNEYDLLLFKDLNDIDKVIKYRGEDLFINREDLKLTGEYLNDDLIGFECYFNDKCLGNVIDIIDAGNDNEIIKIKNYFIPKQDYFIEKVDLINKKLYFKNVKELIK